MRSYEIEQYILACIVIKPSLINELYVDMSCFSDDYHKWLITFLKKAYDKFKRFDPVVLTNAIKDTNSKSKFILYFNELQELVAVPGSFYEYQEMLVDYKKENLIKLFFFLFLPSRRGAKRRISIYIILYSIIGGHFDNTFGQFLQQLYF